MAATYLHLLVILLVFSHLCSLNAVPITRTRSLFHETQTQDLATSENTHQYISDDTWEQEHISTGRMDLEKEDYPGSGPNNRHTPPAGRG